MNLVHLSSMNLMIRNASIYMIYQDATLISVIYWNQKSCHKSRDGGEMWKTKCFIEKCTSLVHKHDLIYYSQFRSILLKPNDDASNEIYLTKHFPYLQHMLKSLIKSKSWQENLVCLNFTIHLTISKKTFK